MKQLIVLSLILFSFSFGQNYRYSGYLYQSSPEASLFLSNPSYISPAQAYGVTGMFANPAALGFSADYGLAFSVGTPANPKINCRFRILDSTDRQSELKIPFQLGFKEAGGINFLGISKKLGPVGLGFGYMQKSATGIGFDYNVQDDTFIINYTFKDTVEASYAGRDTSIPVTWQLSAPLAVNSRGQGEFSLAKQPLFFGIGSATGPLGYGIGVKLQKYSGNLDGSMFLAGGAQVIGFGTPDLPFKGRIDAVGILPYDTFVVASGNGEFNANRTSLVAGGLVRTGIFKLGITLEKSMATELDGDFNIFTGIVDQISDSIITDTNIVNFIFPDSVYGRKVMRLIPQSLDYDTSGFQGPVTLPGYTQVDLGISVFVLDLYLGATIPQKQEINNLKAGLLLNIPLLIVSLRTGLLASLDYYYTNDSKIIPLRAPVYLGLGGSVRTKINFLPIIPDAQIDFGVKSNAVPLFSKAIFDLLNEDNDFDMITDFESPSFLSLLSFNLGLSLKL